ncbi:MAG: DsbA family protein [Candidatus Spechtbacterales bacterium]
MTEKKTSEVEIKELESKLKDLKKEDKGGDNNQFLIPLSIIIAGMFIAAAVYLSGGATTGTNQVANNNQPGNTAEPVPPGTSAEIEMKEVTSDDWIKGDSNAPVKIVEYSDLECPFCQRIHSTLNQIVEDYDGQVAWVYRHAPLEQLHSKAPREAEAAECAGELGGNDAFWAFIDRVFEVGPMNNGLADSQLPEIAVYAGVNRSAFQTCLDSGRYADKVADSLEDAFNAGLRGTPYSVVVAPNGETYPVDGAQPYDSIKAIVDLALQAN